MFQTSKNTAILIRPFDKKGFVDIVNTNTGKIYHRRYIDSENQIKVNLKPGNYEIQNGLFIKEVNPETYNLSKIKLPKKDRNQEKAYFFEPNHQMQGPAQIYPDTGKIEVGPKFYKQTEQIQEFIICHELGHFYYDEEEAADRFALYEFLKNGGNQSAAYDALHKVLSPCKNATLRINNILELIKTT